MALETTTPTTGLKSPSSTGLDPLWQRAAVLGSLWAASEIVLGSFLHNLRVPFSGHSLTAIAIVIGCLVLTGLRHHFDDIAELIDRDHGFGLRFTRFQGGLALGLGQGLGLFFLFLF